MAGLISMFLVGCSGGGAAVDSSAGGAGDTASDLRESVLFLAETGAGRFAWLDATDGTVLGEQCLSEVFPEACSEPGCHVFGGWERAGEPVFAYTRNETGREGRVSGAVQLSPGRPPAVLALAESLDWDAHAAEGWPDCSGEGPPAICRLRQPHQVVIDDAGNWVVADTGHDRVLWLSPEGAVLAVLDSQHPDWGGCGWPNGLSWAPEGLVLTCKGGQGGAMDEGQIALWDVSDPTAPI